MSARSYLSIGQVLELLRQEFPDLTISKIRFLESQGLLDPERTPSGYRKFYDQDVERLRFILKAQQEQYLPLKVIKGRLGPEDEGDDEPAPAGVGLRTNGSATEADRGTSRHPSVMSGARTVAGPSVAPAPPVASIPVAPLPSIPPAEREAGRPGTGARRAGAGGGPSATAPISGSGVAGGIRPLTTWPIPPPADGGADDASLTLEELAAACGLIALRRLRAGAVRSARRPADRRHHLLRRRLRQIASVAARFRRLRRRGPTLADVPDRGRTRGRVLRAGGHPDAQAAQPAGAPSGRRHAPRD